VTGTILELVSGRGTGIIGAEDGSRLLFSATAVLGDFSKLAVGQRVTFDLDHSLPPGGNAVRILRYSVPVPTPKPDARPDLRYGGFEQSAGFRHYRFDSVARGEASRRYVVTVEIALLARHHIAVQELPSLCMHKILAALETSSESTRHELNSDDLRAFATSRAAEAERKRRKTGFHPQKHGATASPWRRPAGAG
jgi:hypothetical protein